MCTAFVLARAAQLRTALPCRHCCTLPSVSRVTLSCDRQRRVEWRQVRCGPSRRAKDEKKQPSAAPTPMRQPPAPAARSASRHSTPMAERHADNKTRCPWAGQSERLARYHDEEWGVFVGVDDDQRMLEMLTLEGAQAGLSFNIVLSLRENYRAAFRGFDVRAVAAMSDEELERLSNADAATPKIVRQRKKVFSVRNNARCVLELQKEFGSLHTYLSSFLPDGRPQCNHYADISRVPRSTEVSARMCKDMRKRGFAYVGPVTLYSLMQAVGMVNDHLLTCFRHKELRESQAYGDKGSGV